MTRRNLTEVDALIRKRETIRQRRRVIVVHFGFGKLESGFACLLGVGCTDIESAHGRSRPQCCSWEAVGAGGLSRNFGSFLSISETHKQRDIGTISKVSISITSEETLRSTRTPACRQRNHSLKYFSFTKWETSILNLNHNEWHCL